MLHNIFLQCLLYIKIVILSINKYIFQKTGEFLDYLPTKQTPYPLEQRIFKQQFPHPAICKRNSP